MAAKKKPEPSEPLIVSRKRLRPAFLVSSKMTDFGHYLGRPAKSKQADPAPRSLAQLRSPEKATPKSSSTPSQQPLVPPLSQRRPLIPSKPSPAASPKAPPPPARKVRPADIDPKSGRDRVNVEREKAYEEAMRQRKKKQKKR